MSSQPKGSRYGLHRVLEPKGALPQPALRVDNNMDVLYDNEILCDVNTLNIDAASFTQIREQAKDDEIEIRRSILDIVARFGKHKNPVTGSGGMFVGKVAAIGNALKGKIDLSVGDKIASLVSLSLTPLKIDEILAVHQHRDQVDVHGKAILFESAVWAKLPADVPEKLALAVLDVAGAPAQTAKLVKPGDTVLVIGAAGKSGLLCAYEAKRRAGVTGRVIGANHNPERIAFLERTPFVDDVILGSARDAVDFLQKIETATDGKLCDVVINCVNVPDCEMGAILACRDGGTVYFFSMATSFTKAALGAEGVGKDVTMIIGNGYTKHHARIALELLRESRFIREEFEKRYLG
ncbi:MAG: L-erythro-3,5-diaminohexanoate dehydrogenase [Myxococcales bacterium]|nr:MAG: L-erythro-3,5-diaminohexanoate dehydrogenase [Myxococcales bacterium]